MSPAAETGEQIYKKQCASCHGAAGEGVKDRYANPLIGDRSLAELTEYIETSMPEEDPGTCVGEDAKAVASQRINETTRQIFESRN